MALNRREFMSRIMAGCVGGAIALGLREISPVAKPIQEDAKPLTKTKMRHIFLLDDTERHWISAENENEALKIYVELYGDDETEDVLVEQIDDSQELVVYMEEPFREPSRSKMQTCREWADGQSGMFASSLY